MPWATAGEATSQAVYEPLDRQFRSRQVIRRPAQLHRPRGLRSTAREERGAMHMTDVYDEFGMFHENADEFGIPWRGAPDVRRVEVSVGGGQTISALVWGVTPPEIVLVHGGAQNAHTWDTVALALDRPLVAIDLPGHGHSSHRPDHVY